MNETFDYSEMREKDRCGVWRLVAYEINREVGAAKALLTNELCSKTSKEVCYSYVNSCILNVKLMYSSCQHCEDIRS